MAGAGGMPMMGAFGAIYNMFAEDDEDDFKALEVAEKLVQRNHCIQKSI